MILPKKYLPINWTGSMKFNETHFIENEQSIYDTIRDSLSVNINAYNYGILPPFVGQTQSLDLQITQRSDQFVQVTLNGLNGVTAGGMRIFINSKNEHESVTYTHTFSTVENAVEKDEDQAFDIVLKVNTEERVLVGEPDPEEIPPRIPYIGPKYALSVLPTNYGSTDSVSYLVIGRVIRQENQFLVDESYIPPCTALLSHSALLQAYKDFGNILSLLQSDALKILGKIHLRKQHVGLPHTLELMCRELLGYIGSIHFEYYNIIKQQPPIMMVNHFSTLANRILVFLNCLHAVEKEELLNYFYQWIDVTPGLFVEVLTQCAGITYQHQNIKQSLEPISKFLNTFTAICQRLSTLEYIGQRKDNVVITEQTQNRQNQGLNPSQTWKTID